MTKVVVTHHHQRYIHTPLLPKYSIESNFSNSLRLVWFVCMDTPTVST